ncbi:MAG TPA: DUF2267 domain-containing protein [Caulobacteraceae bacterium]|jgi:uncharacterized protein (DUF2267 family)|nr:DUF2267 domain-containing protein [Caulobacteraceae bacterium]
MSANGLEVFDKTLQTTNIWLGDIMKTIGPDRHAAWKVLSVVLHKLRDRLPVEVAAHLSAELPLLIRGVYYDQYEPARQPSGCRNIDEFIHEVREWLTDARPMNAKEAIAAVFATLSRHISEGQIVKVQGALPESIRRFWIVAAQDVTTPDQVHADLQPDRQAEIPQAETRSFAAAEAGGLAETGPGIPDEAAGPGEMAIDDQLAMGEDPTAQAMAEKLRREAEGRQAAAPEGL